MKDNESAEIVCMECGFVIVTEIANQGPEWRAFDAEQRAKRARAGAPSTLTVHDKGLATTIDWHDRDSMGKRIPTAQKAQIYRFDENLAQSCKFERYYLFCFIVSDEIVFVLDIKYSKLFMDINNDMFNCSTQKFLMKCLIFRCPL